MKKLTKRAVAFLLTLLLILTIFPMTALADDVDVTTWDQLIDAINDTSNSGDAIHVQGDITLASNITLTNHRLIITGVGSITTGNFTITQDYTSVHNDTFKNKGTINVSSGGAIIISSGCAIDNRGTINNSGTITNNGTIINSGTITGNAIGGTAPPNITTTSPLPRGTVNAAYTTTLTAENSPTSWSLSNNPAWISIDNSGVITGTPTAAGMFNFEITATNSGGSHTKQFSITVAAVAPGAPSNVTATAGNGQATISFDAPASDGGSPITSYTVTSNPGSFSASSATSPITVTGLSNGTEYTFTVTATNVAGGGLASTASNSVTPVKTHTITATAGTGGSISPSGSVSVNNGGSQTFTIAPQSGYSISDVTVDGSSVGARGSYTFTNVTSNHSISATFYYNRTSRSTSSGSDSGSGKNTFTGATYTPQESFYWMTKAELNALIAAAKENGRPYILIRRGGSFGISKADALYVAQQGYYIMADTTGEGAVQVRAIIPEPGKATADLTLSGAVKGDSVDKIRTHFEKFFKNKLRVVRLEQQTAWGQPVQIVAKVDLTGIDTKNLCFYSYDKATNSYRRIENPAYWIDTNGYLHFTAEYAGDIVISDGALEKK